MSKSTKADPLIQKLFENKTNNAYPTVVVSGSGDAWFLNPKTKTMERIFRGSVVQRVSTIPGDRDWETDDNKLIEKQVTYVKDKDFNHEG